MAAIGKMAATIRGRAVHWGCGNITVTGYATSEPTGFRQSFGLQRTANNTEITDDQGDCRTLVFSNAKKDGNEEIIIEGAALAAVEANIDKFFAPSGTILTYTQTPTNTVGKDHGGKYLVLSADLRYVNTDVARVTLTIVQYDANNVAVAVT